MEGRKSGGCFCKGRGFCAWEIVSEALCLPVSTLIHCPSDSLLRCVGRLLKRHPYLPIPFSATRLVCLLVPFGNYTDSHHPFICLARH